MNDSSNIAVDIDNEWIVVSAYCIDVEDLVRIGRFIGAVEDKKDK